MWLIRAAEGVRIRLARNVAPAPPTHPFQPMTSRGHRCAVCDRDRTVHPTTALCKHGYPSSHWIGLPTGNDPDGRCPGPRPSTDPDHLPDDEADADDECRHPEWRTVEAEECVSCGHHTW